MKSNLNDLIKKSVIQAPLSINKDQRETQADILIKNADKALGISAEDIKDGNTQIKNKRTSSVINQTFSVTNFDIKIIETTHKKFLQQGEIVSKSEIIRIGLQLVSKLTDTQLLDSLELITRKSKNGW